MTAGDIKTFTNWLHQEYIREFLLNKVFKDLYQKKSDVLSCYRILAKWWGLLLRPLQISVSSTLNVQVLTGNIFHVFEIS